MKQNKPAPSHILVGGETIDITLPDGTKSSAFVRQVKPSELPAYLEAEARGEEAVLTMVATIDGQPIDPDALTLDSYELLIEADQRQNFIAARKREKREGERAGRMLDSLKTANPSLHAKLIKNMETETLSLISSLTPSPEAAAAGESAQKG